MGQWLFLVCNIHSVPIKYALDAPLHSLAPSSASLAIRGGANYIVENSYADGIVCHNCYYVDNLSMGSSLLRIYAINMVGVSTSASTPIAVNKTCARPTRSS